MPGKIHFFVEEIDFKVSKPRVLKPWLLSVAEGHGKQVAEINYIFVSDEYLLRLNLDFLKHDTLTDIITFPHDTDSESTVGGDIYISVERVRENAESFKTSFENELHRVMVHGLLHLVGFGDKGAQAKKEMRKLEDSALALLVV